MKRRPVLHMAVLVMWVGARGRMKSMCGHSRRRPYGPSNITDDISKVTCGHCLKGHGLLLPVEFRG